MNKPYFVVELSNSEIVVQKENDNPNTWVSLSARLKNDHDIKIKNMKVVFNNSEIALPSNKNGYFFGNKVSKIWPIGREQKNCIGAGYLHEDGAVVVTWFDYSGKEAGKETRTKEKAGFLLICNE